ncbi:MAG: IS1595 family transposase [Rhodospirillales bacterium]|nr:IS1595 family transposase [Rhodospirillales bacterium]
MTRKAPGRSHRKGLTVMELLRMFPDNAAAERWFEDQRWGKSGRFCPDCGSCNTATVASRKPMPYRCRDCRAHFSVRKGTVMQSSKLGLQKWAIALYMMTTGIKGTSSMKLYREVGIRQGTAWFLMQRIREAFNEGASLPFPGPVEVDETYMGGKRKNMSNAKRRQLAKEGAGRGSVGKVAVVGAKDRATKQVTAKVVQETDKPTLQGFVKETAAPGATVYTDEATAYSGLPFDHETVKHSVSEYVRGMAHTNGIESFWSMFERGFHGTFHKMSPKHLNRYVQEFAGRNNIRDMDTIAQMTAMVRQMEGKRLRYVDLIADNGLDSGARSA